MPVLVPKLDNAKPSDKPRLTWNYSYVRETMPGTYLELIPRAHDYLSDLRHQCYFIADLKHRYYAIELEPESRQVFAFYMNGFGQLQPTRMPQGSRSAGHTMSKLMNIALGPIPEPQAEPSLLEWIDERGILDIPVKPDVQLPLPPMAFYQDDLFGGAELFDEMLKFLKDHLFPRLEWAKLRLSFKKLKLFVADITVLGTRHHVGEGYQ